MSENMKTTKKEPRAHIPEEQPRTHGGARPGAGRPRTGSRSILFRATRLIAEHLERQPNKSGYIKACIEKDMAATRQESATGLAQLMPCAEATLPFVDVAVAAGEPIGTDEAQYGEPVNLLSFFPRAKLVARVEGRSMEDAGIDSGDMLLIDNEAVTVNEHDIALCELNGQYTVKHVQRQKDGSLLLVPRNCEYLPIHVTAADRFFIRGRVVGVMKHL